MSTFNADALAQRLRVIEGSADGIRTLSRYFLTNYRRAAECVKTWRSVVATVEPTKLLALLYLANDVAQRSIKLGSSYLRALETALPVVLARIGRDARDVMPKAERVLKIWKERGVYPAAVVAGFTDTLKKADQDARSNPDPLSASFEPDDADDVNGDEARTPPGTPPPSPPSRAAAIKVASPRPRSGSGSGSGNGSGSGSRLIDDAGAGGGTELPLAERIETRKHALATCAWLAARMGMPQVYDLLQPGWDIRNNFHRRREDLAAEVDYARHLVLDLKGMLEGMLSEEAALSRQLRHAEAEHRAGLAATDRQLEECRKLQERLTALQKSEAEGKQVVRPRVGGEVLSMLSGPSAVDDVLAAAELDTGGAGAGGGADALEEKKLAEAAAEVGHDDVAQELLKEALAEKEAKRKEAEAAAAAREDSVFKFDPDNPNAGKDMVWNPLLHQYTEKVAMEAWRDK